MEVEAENIILGNGSIELIYAITETLPSAFEAVIPVPSFSEYEKAAIRIGGKAVFVQLPQDFSLNSEKIKRAVTKDTKIMCICNPHSPSGTLYSKESVLDLVEFCQEKGIIFSIDENYIEFAESGEDTTLAGMVKNYENLFVIRSVTKFYGMAGIRFGYGIATENLVKKLENVRLPWSINGLACYATLAAFADTEFIANTKATIAREREALFKNLNAIGGLHCYPSVTNFVLVKIENKKITSTKLKEALTNERILIRDCCTFMGLDDSYFRVTIRSAKDNQKLVDTIKRIIEKIIKRKTAKKILATSNSKFPLKL